MINKSLGIYLLLIILQGCASGLPYKEAAKPEAGFGVVYIYRSFALQAAAYGTDVYIDNQLAVSLRTSTYSHFYLKNGSHKFSSLGPDRFPIYLDIKDSETYFLEINSTVVGIKNVPFDIGKKNIDKYGFFEQKQLQFE